MDGSCSCEESLCVWGELVITLAVGVVGTVMALVVTDGILDVAHGGAGTAVDEVHVTDEVINVPIVEVVVGINAAACDTSMEKNNIIV